MKLKLKPQLLVVSIQQHHHKDPQADAVDSLDRPTGNGSSWGTVLRGDFLAGAGLAYIQGAQETERRGSLRPRG